MTRSVEKSAKTVEDAVSAALHELSTVKEKVEIVVLDEGSKGIFGLIGSKRARVRVTLKETPVDRAENFIRDIIEKMFIRVDADIKEDNGGIQVNLKGKDVGVLIGRRGETLDSLQYLTSLIVNKGEEKYKKVVVDTENYRDKREDTLENLAQRLADKVIRQKRNVTLEPMTPYERRIIHSTLQNNKYVETYSIGDEPHRKIVIKLK